MKSEILLQPVESVAREFKYHVAQPLDLAKLNPHQAHSIILGQVPVGARVLDIGCATGYLGRFLVEERGCVVDGVEFDPDAAGKSKEFLRSVRLGSIEDGALLSGISEKYDVVLCAAILEHLARPDLALQRLRELIADGGVLIAGLPNVAHWSVRWALLCGRWDYAEYGILDRTHLHFYTLQSAREMFESAGYVINRIEVSDIGVGPLQTVLRLLPRGRIWLRNWFVNRFPTLFAYEMIFNVKVRGHRA